MCMYIYIYTQIHIHVFRCSDRLHNISCFHSVYMYIYILCVCSYAYMCAGWNLIHIYIYTHLYTHIYIYIYVYIYIYTYVYTYICIYTYIYIYIYVCTYCIHAYTYISWEPMCNYVWYTDRQTWTHPPTSLLLLYLPLYIFVPGTTSRPTCLPPCWHTYASTKLTYCTHVITYIHICTYIHRSTLGYREPGRYIHSLQISKTSSIFCCLDSHAQDIRLSNTINCEEPGGEHMEGEARIGTASWVHLIRLVISLRCDRQSLRKACAFSA